MTEPNFLPRLIRIETRLARIQESLGIPTRMDQEDLKRLEFSQDQPVSMRLMHIETRLCKLMEIMSLNPRTGAKQ